MPDPSAFGLDAAAVVVALCALYLTVQSNKTTREHNKLSVKPRLTTETSTNRTTYLDGSTHTVEFRMTLTNVGLGPAVVKSSQVMLDGAPLPVESTDDIQPLLERVFPGVQLGSSAAFFKLNKEHAVQVGKEVELVSFVVMNPSSDFDKELKRFSIRICHESLYGETLHYDTRDHLQP